MWLPFPVLPSDTMPERMNMLNELKIGEFELVKQPNRQAKLRCFLPWEGTFSIDLLDSRGRSYLHESTRLNPGQHELVFDLPKLPAGEYNAWINMGDQTVIRKMNIKGGQSRSFFSRLLG
jgi:hypothetical protein